MAKRKRRGFTEEFKAQAVRVRLSILAADLGCSQASRTAFWRRTGLHVRVHQFGEPRDRFRLRGRLAEPREERALQVVLAVPGVVAADRGSLVLRARAAVPDLLIARAPFRRVAVCAPTAMSHSAHRSIPDRRYLG